MVVSRLQSASARFRPDFEYSGQIELVVWSIPTLTVMLLAGVIWVGSHDLDPAGPLARIRQPLTIQVVSLDWKWLFLYPDQKVASVNELVSRRRAAASGADVGQRDDGVLRAAVGQHDLHDERHDDAANLRVDEAGDYLGMRLRSAATASPT